jgi:hypothetical protein
MDCHRTGKYLSLVEENGKMFVAFDTKYYAYVTVQTYWELQKESTKKNIK